MTRARLLAEGDADPNGDSSVHSGGNSSKGSGDQPLCITTSGSGGQTSSQQYSQYRKNSADAVSVSSGRSGSNSQGMVTQGYQGQQQQHQRMPQQQQQIPYQYPRHVSPIFGNAPSQFIANQPSPRQPSPSFGVGPRADTWETASVASTLASEYQGLEPVYPTATNMPFSSTDGNVMAFNRGRCFSAGAGVPTTQSSFEPQTSWDEQQLAAPYYENNSTTNRRRCATMSPPGMSRLHEDRPFLFSGEEKDRLAIPPLSEPRPRFHSTGLVSAQGGAFQSLGNGNAFKPVGMTGGSNSNNNSNMPQSPPPLNVDRVKFNADDRALSTGSNFSVHGDLPSSMAESVLESLTSISGPALGDILGNSPFRPSVNEKTNGVTSAFRFDTLLKEPSGSGSLFSTDSGSRSICPPDNSGERLLMGTNSWGGEGEEGLHSTFGLSHDFSSLLNFSGESGSGLRGRAATAPENHLPFVSRIDPEHGEAKADGPAMSLPFKTASLPGFLESNQQS